MAKREYPTDNEAKQMILEVGRRMYQKNFVAANDGNISVMAEPGRLLITPSGVSKGRMTPDMLLVTDLEGNVIEGDRHPSSEGKMHLAVYRARPEVRAVVERAWFEDRPMRVTYRHGDGTISERLVRAKRLLAEKKKIPL